MLKREQKETTKKREARTSQQKTVVEGSKCRQIIIKNEKRCSETLAVKGKG